MSRNEAQTRKDLIDRALETAEWMFQDSQRQNSANLCLSPQLRTATPQKLKQVIADLGDGENRFILRNTANGLRGRYWRL